MATGWLLSMFVPTQWHTAVTANIVYTAAVVQQLTLKDDTERALPNLLSDAEVIAHDAIGSSGLRGVVR